MARTTNGKSNDGSNKRLQAIRQKLSEIELPESDHPHTTALYLIRDHLVEIIDLIESQSPEQDQQEGE